MRLAETEIRLEVGVAEGHANDLPPYSQTSGFALEDILDWLSPAPAGTALLGLCSDGRPLLLDLARVSMGGVLLLDPRLERSRSLLDGIISSAIRLSPPSSIEVALISPHLESFSMPPEGAHAFDWADSGEEKAPDLLYHFLSSARDHPSTSRDRLLHLLILDEVDRLFPHLDRYIQGLLAWATAEGPARGYRVIASTASVDGLLPKAFLACFGTRITGHHPGSRSSLQPLAPQIDPASYVRDGYHTIRSSGETMPFWRPRSSVD